MWRIFKTNRKQELRSYYKKLRLDAIEAQKCGDVKRYLALNAIADNYMDQVIYSE